MRPCGEMLWNWLFARFRRNPTPPEIVLLTRVGCHLCEEAKQLLGQLQGRYAFTLRLVDVDGDATLVQSYGDKVPVILVQNRPRLWGRINARLLERLVRKTCPTRRTRPL